MNLFRQMPVNTRRQTAGLSPLIKVSKKNRKKTVPEPIPASEPVHIPLPEPVPELELSSEELSNEPQELSNELQKLIIIWSNIKLYYCE